MSTKDIRRVCALAALVIWALHSRAASAADPALGTWRVGGMAIQVDACGSTLCGHIIWLEHPEWHGPICNKPFFGDVQNVGNNAYSGGWLNNPETGTRYDLVAQLTSPSTFHVRVYRLVTWFGQSFDLKRINASTLKGKKC